MPDTLPDPALMLEARDAAFNEWHSLDRQKLSDAELAIVEPMIFRVLNAFSRQIVLRFVLTEKG